MPCQGSNKINCKLTDYRITSVPAEQQHPQSSRKPTSMAPNTEDQDSRDSVEVEELKTSPSAIWTAEEKAILKDSIAGYRNATKKLKGAYIVQTVIPKVKASWKGRYGKRNMARDPVAKGEWAKKKKVRIYSASVWRILRLFTASLHLVLQPCRDVQENENTRVQ